MRRSLSKGGVIMERKTATVAVFADHEKAEAAIRSLQNAGIDMKKLSIVGSEKVTQGTRRQHGELRLAPLLFGVMPP
jgi:hypothetical protein